jgi:hypothetical protein
MGKPRKVQYVTGQQKPQPGSTVLSLCSSCPLGRKVVDLSTKAVVKELKKKWGSR